MLQGIKCFLGEHDWGYSGEKWKETRIPHTDNIDRVLISFPKKCKYCEKEDMVIGEHLERVK